MLVMIDNEEEAKAKTEELKRVRSNMILVNSELVRVQLDVPTPCFRLTATRMTSRPSPYPSTLELIRHG